MLAHMIYRTFRDMPRAGWRWPHFTPEDLACKCRDEGCRGEYFHDPGFLDALEALRAQVRPRLRINSAHRCAFRNAVAGGAPGSEHRRLAVDISLSGQDRERLIAAAEAAGFTGIGMGRGFLHLDRRETPARWTCPATEKPA